MRIDNSEENLLIDYWSNLAEVVNPNFIFANGDIESMSLYLMIYKKIKATEKNILIFDSKKYLDLSTRILEYSFSNVSQIREIYGDKKETLIILKEIKKEIKKRKKKTKEFLLKITMNQN